MAIGTRPQRRTGPRGRTPPRPGFRPVPPDSADRRDVGVAVALRLGNVEAVRPRVARKHVGAGTRREGRALPIRRVQISRGAGRRPPALVTQPAPFEPELDVALALEEGPRLLHAHRRPGSERFSGGVADVTGAHLVDEGHGGLPVPCVERRLRFQEPHLPAADDALVVVAAVVLGLVLPLDLAVGVQARGGVGNVRVLEPGGPRVSRLRVVVLDEGVDDGVGSRRLACVGLEDGVVVGLQLVVVVDPEDEVVRDRRGVGRGSAPVAQPGVRGSASATRRVGFLRGRSKPQRRRKAVNGAVEVPGRSLFVATGRGVVRIRRTEHRVTPPLPHGAVGEGVPEVRLVQHVVGRSDLGEPADRRLRDEAGLHPVVPAIGEASGQNVPGLGNGVVTHEPGLAAREQFPGQDGVGVAAVGQQLRQAAHAAVDEALLGRRLGQELVLDGSGIGDLAARGRHPGGCGDEKDAGEADSDVSSSFLCHGSALP